MVSAFKGYAISIGTYVPVIFCNFGIMCLEIVIRNF